MSIEIREIAKIWGNRTLYVISSSNVIHTYIGFGVIDRGTNVLQVRPTTLCPLNCIFCSVDAGPYSRNRVAEFIVDLDTMINSVKAIAEYKGGGIEALIDTIGEGLTYPQIFDLIRLLKRLPSIESVALETHGLLLSIDIVKKLEEAGLDRINLSIDSLNPEKARFLQGVEWYDVNKVREIAEYIARETSIDLHVTPVWIPGINDKDVVEIIEWAYRIGTGKKWPPATIQKYVVHKYGRKIPGIKPLSWKSFWRWVREFESRYGLRISWDMSEWGMKRTKRYPCEYKRGDKLIVDVLAPGVFRGEFISVDKSKNVIITLTGKGIKIGYSYYAEIIEDRDCLLIARAIHRIRI
ncbi:MAG: radical SAM protein [Thermoprotei archaeon]